MRATTRIKTAVIPAVPHVSGARDAFVGQEYQWAVDMGIAMADEYLPQLGAIPLHTFVSGCAARFRLVLQQAAAEAGQVVPLAELHAAAEAFASGLLGRLQQYMLAGLNGDAHSDSRAATNLH